LLSFSIFDMEVTGAIIDLPSIVLSPIASSPALFFLAKLPHY